MLLLHFLPKADANVSQYVQTLAKGMAAYADVEVCTSVGSLRRAMAKAKPDIIHLHGCWPWALALGYMVASRRGVRMVHSPHGQLEPWIAEQNRWRDKLPKTALYLRRMMAEAYAIIVMGRMEENCLRRFTRNPRVETVLNPLVTASISPEEACRQVFSVYRKTLDTDTYALMKPRTRDALRTIIKAGTARHAQYMSEDELEPLAHLDNDEWRKLALYAYQADISQTWTLGLETLSLNPPDINAAETPTYSPRKSQTPLRPNANDEDPAERVSNLIGAAAKAHKAGTLAMAHVVELASELRKADADEAKVADNLAYMELTRFAGRLMHALADLAGLDEGFMPTPPIADNGAEKIKANIINQQKT